MARLKTLLFCTSYSLDQNTWTRRYQKWLDHYQHSPLHFDQILLIDDGSPSFANLRQIEVINHLPETRPQSSAVLYHFQNHLGRNDIKDFPGWFRSFTFVLSYAKQYGFEKIVHLESDFYVLSEPLFAWINSLSSGWSTLFSQHYNFPECAIQVINQDQFNAYEHLAKKDYAKEYVGWDMETVLPFTQVNKSFIGDRSDAINPEQWWAGDYLAQVKGAMVPPSQLDTLTNPLAPLTPLAPPSQSSQTVHSPQGESHVPVSPGSANAPSLIQADDNAQLNTISMTSEDVIGAYRILFERDPKSGDPIKELIGTTPDQLLAYLMLRPEFRNRPGIAQLIMKTAQSIQPQAITSQNDTLNSSQA
jgi:hypothetical protein